MTQELPRWAGEKPERRPKAPSPADVARAKGQAWICEECQGRVTASVDHCPVCGYGKPSKPKSALAPKEPMFKLWDDPKPKPKQPTTLALHVEVEVHGTMTFDIEGKQANDMAALFAKQPTVDKMLDVLDPWISGLKVFHEIVIIEDPVGPGDPYRKWFVREEQGDVEVRINGAISYLPTGWRWLEGS